MQCRLEINVLSDLQIFHLIAELTSCQVMWSTFVPFIPASILPGTVFGALALLLAILVYIILIGSVFSHYG